VINEDWIQGGTGFGAHPHRDMEIITYVVAGCLTHQDSLGNKATISPNEVQRMTAGTGIVHSEANPEPKAETHLFQIWIKPERQGLAPSYGQKSFADELSSGKPVLVVSRDGRNGSISINQDADLYITRFAAAKVTTFVLRPKRSAWVQIVAGNVSVNGQVLKAGDAIAATDKGSLTVAGEQGAEVMIFDLRAA
jgi:redox-sensitive bicupin YhaK (pirin superfamily)